MKLPALCSIHDSGMVIEPSVFFAEKQVVDTAVMMVTMMQMVKTLTSSENTGCLMSECHIKIYTSKLPKEASSLYSHCLRNGRDAEENKKDVKGSEEEKKKVQKTKQEKVLKAKWRKSIF